MLEFGRTLPKIRAVVGRHLSGGTTLSRQRVLAAAIRLIDLGFFRPGGEEYAAENGSYGLATIRREHVRCTRNGEITFGYTGKSGKQQEQAIVDSGVFSVVRGLKRRRSRPDRTWHATVLAGVGLAVSVPAATSPTARKRAVARVVKEVASYLGNTPAVARASYIDPRIIGLYEKGITIARALPDLGRGQEFGDAATHGRAERAVLDLLTSGKPPKDRKLTTLAV